MQLGLKALMLGGLLAAGAAQAADSIDGKHFGDWGGACDSKLCYIQQALSSKGQLLMATAIGYLPGKPFPAVLIQLPKGAQLQEGVLLQVDNHAAIKFEGKCEKDSCFAGFALDQKMQQQFQQGSKAVVSFIPAPKQKPVSLPLSLKGIGKGLSALPKS
ncbi:invasion associated locus B family protein [Candidatus Thiothrix sp. Deng01]|uniref:Invasion associated locus B family protein n=1 Tax=Candidatus Thiothrix phosphatis TaxID=3112415 RepID=A0ABU6CXY4_9GAMM|nr:invasion associated locus B family protein [Candidatus Thiothrix sp. Deng01]MEB4591684.1 invasion associated locus B family protein [Candidatus Thiothrix sp. Deng01]